jgi:hypothetical protein
MKEQQIISLLKTIDYQNLNHIELSEILKDHGFLHNDLTPYNEAQVSSLLHSLRTQLKAEFKKANPPIDRCGIDRAHNPCGDASDY